MRELRLIMGMSTDNNKSVVEHNGLKRLADAIEINVKERSLAASVKYKDKYLCIDENGKLIVTMIKGGKSLRCLPE